LLAKVGTVAVVRTAATIAMERLMRDMRYSFKVN